MAETRVTQHRIEVLGDPDSSVRVTQDRIETLVNPDSVTRVTQHRIEVLILPNPNARVTQIATEVLDQSSNLNARVTQIATEVLDQPSNRNARVTQVAVEILRSVHLVTVTLTADAWLKAPRSGFVNANAVLKRNQTGSFAADSVLRQGRTGSFTANAAIGTPSITFTANAITRAVHHNAFLADAALGYRAAVLDAVLKKTLSGSFIAGAIFVNYRAQFTANAFLARYFQANATIRKPTTHTFTADAIYGHFVQANAVLRRTNSKSFTVDARFLRHSFTARAVIKSVTPAPLIIKVSGLDVTNDVEIATAKFTQAVNARPGQFEFEVKDAKHVYQFVSGGRVTFDVHGARLFDGYVTRATVHYAFPVDTVTDPTKTPRIWKLEGPDLNILFSKRVIFDQVNPNAELPTYAAGTSDKTIVMDIINNYIDLTKDEITTDGVKAVGSPNPDADGYLVQVGSSWAEVMGAIAQLPGAVWGLSQDRDLFYEDANTENAPFQLSDTPNQTTTFGYSNFTWTDDGTKLVNDSQVWGAGTGSVNGVRVYSEVTDATSIAAHGRWQLPGQFRGDMFRQATVDHAATSIVYGSTQNLHGGKDPYIVVHCRVKKHGLRAGMKVRFINSVFGYDQVLPIRRVTVTFVNKRDVLYDLELTREIDEPWFFAEFAGYPKLAPLQDRAPHLIVPSIVLPPLPGCNAEVCGITDSFNRPLNAFGWGRSDDGADWRLTTTGYGTARTDGTRGWMKAVRGQPCGMELVGANITAPIDVRFDILISAIKNMPLDWLTFDIGGMTVRFDYGSSNHAYEGAATELWIGENGTGNAAAVKHSYIAGLVHHVHLTYTPNTNMTASVWADGSPEPVTPDLTMISVTAMQSVRPTFTVYSTNPPPHTEPYGPGDINTADGPIIYIDNLDIAGVNRCTEYRFDKFTRTVANGLGTSSDGHTWSPFGSVSAPSTWGVNGTAFFLDMFGSKDVGATVNSPGGWDGAFTMTARCMVNPIPVSTGIGGPTYSKKAEFYFYLNGTSPAQISVDVSTQTIVGAGANRPLIALTDDGGTVTSNVAVNANTTFTNGGYFFIEWIRSATVAELRIWQEGQTRPVTALLTTASTLAGTVTGLGVDLNGFGIEGSITHPPNGEEISLFIDYIDFNYAGKPCYLACPPIDYNLPFTSDYIWNLTPAVGCTVFGFRSCQSNGLYDADAGVYNPSGYVYMYGGATYEIQYEVVHSYSSQTLHPSLYSGLTSVEFDVDTGAASECWLWPVPSAVPPLNSVKVTGTQYTSAWMNAYLNSSMCCCNSNAGSSMVAWVRYISGPDPRFVGLADQPCVPVSSAVGQPSPAPGSNGSQTALRVSSTVYEVWVAYIPGTTMVFLNGRLLRLTYDYTEDPTNGIINFVLPVSLTDVVYVLYLAAGVADIGPRTGGT